MFACLFGKSPWLVELAAQFSPLVEKVADDMVVLSLAGLGSLFGDVHQIASEISRRGEQMEITASLAIAANKSTAMLVARNFRGVRIIEPGREAETLAEIRLKALPASPELLVTLSRWGIQTLGELAALPEMGIKERLGNAGSELRRLALGHGIELLTLHPPPAEYVMRREFDDPIELLEPVFLVISAQLHELTDRLQRNGKATSCIMITLTLNGGMDFVRTLTLPLAMRDPGALLKQVQLSLEAKPPEAGIFAVQTALLPANPRVIQNGLFRPAAPEPDKLQTLLARLRALVGEEHVGSPEILNTHRPDAHRIRPCAFEPSDPGPPKSLPLRLAFRYFRPPLRAQVLLQNQTPARVSSERFSGLVIQSAGPWRTSGGLWPAASWDRDEWDVVLEDQAVYRIYVTPVRQWFLCGSYD